MPKHAAYVRQAVYKYKLLFKQLAAFAEDKGLRYIAECDVEILRGFRESWTNKNFSARKKLEALRTFFSLVDGSGWLPTNPAKVIKPPKVNDHTYNNAVSKRGAPPCPCRLR